MTALDEDSTLDVRTAHEDARRVYLLTGEIDLATAPRLRSAVREAIEGSDEETVFDLRGVTFMDSSGLSIFLEVAAAGTPMAIRSPSEAARRVIETTGVGHTLGMES